MKGFVVERLDRFDDEKSEWKEVLIEDRRAGPACKTAAARIDVATWLRSLGRKKRRIAQTLARGETTGKVARLFGISAGRVSQLRQEFQKSWNEFQAVPLAA